MFFFVDNEDDIFVWILNFFFKLVKKIKVYLIWMLICKKKINEDYNIR